MPPLLRNVLAPTPRPWTGGLVAVRVLLPGKVLLRERLLAGVTCCPCGRARSHRWAQC